MGDVSAREDRGRGRERRAVVARVNEPEGVLGPGGEARGHRVGGVLLYERPVDRRAVGRERRLDRLEPTTGVIPDWVGGPERRPAVGGDGEPYPCTDVGGDSVARGRRGV